LDTNKQRLLSTKLSPEASSASEELPKEGFMEVAIQLSKELAAAMHSQQKGNPVVQYSHRSDRTTWKVQFFSPAPDTTLLRESSPLTRAGSLLRFLHQSLLEYFYYRNLSDHMQIPTFDYDLPKLDHSACARPVLRFGRIFHLPDKLRRLLKPAQSRYSYDLGEHP